MATPTMMERETETTQSMIEMTTTQLQPHLQRVPGLQAILDHPRLVLLGDPVMPPPHHQQAHLPQCRPITAPTPSRLPLHQLVHEALASHPATSPLHPTQCVAAPPLPIVLQAIDRPFHPNPALTPRQPQRVQALHRPLAHEPAHTPPAETLPIQADEAASRLALEVPVNRTKAMPNTPSDQQSTITPPARHILGPNASIQPAVHPPVHPQ